MNRRARKVIFFGKSQVKLSKSQVIEKSSHDLAFSKIFDVFFSKLTWFLRRYEQRGVFESNLINLDTFLGKKSQVK
jgi:hypothetical protein